MPNSMNVCLQSANSLVILAMIFCGQLLSAADPLSPELLSQAAQRLVESKTQAKESLEFLPRVRKATWQLVVGEMASDATFCLSSGSYDELTQGLKDLDQLIAELKGDQRLERELTQHLQLAMRFDATRSRRSTIEKRRVFSRDEELERLSQLREINRTYRELIGNLVRTQTSLVTGQTDQVANLGSSTAKLLSNVEQIVARRRDYYLFQDEPDFAAPSGEELILVREVAQPIARDVRRHQLALQAYALVELAKSTPQDSREQLMTARKLAEAAIDDSTEPPILAHWAMALATREIGRLETITTPWEMAAHQRASPWFEQAHKHFMAAQQRMSAESGHSSWSAEIQDQLTELDSADFEIQRAMKRLDQGNYRDAIKVLEHCFTLHCSPQVALTLADCRRLAGDSLDELDEFVSRLWSCHLLTDQDHFARLVRGRQGVLGIWQSLNRRPIDHEVAERKQKVVLRLAEALSDLKFAAESADKDVRRVSQLYRALGSVIQLSIAPESNLEIARSQLLTIALVIAELQEEPRGALDQERFNIREATIAGQMAYGYLALRFLDDYRDVAPKAFASAADLRATFPASLTLPQPLGSVILRSMISRADGSDARLASEEQFVRRSYQRAFPSMAAMQFAPTAEAATNLRATARGLDGTGGDSLSLDIDPGESLDARRNAGHEVRTATILAFLASREPVEAMRESLIPFRPEIQTVDLLNFDPNDLRDQLLGEPDPVRKSVVALALEEFATSGLNVSPKNIPGMLLLALDLQKSAKIQFDESTVLQKSRPAEIKMNQQAIKRLVDPEFYLEQSRELLKEFRLSEARKLLESAARHHPASIRLLEAFVQTLIDEADLRPEVSNDLIATAVEQLETLTTNPTQDVFESQMKLAGLYERIANDDRARLIYQQIAQQSGNERQRLLARSRLTVLQVRTMKP